HLLGGGLIGEAASLGGQMCASGPALAARVRAQMTEALPVLYGGRSLTLASFTLTSSISAGSPIVGWLVALVLVVMPVRLALSADARLPGSRSSTDEDGFGAYL